MSTPERPPPDSEDVRSVMHLSRNKLRLGLIFQLPGLYRNCSVCVCSNLKKTLLKCLFDELEEINEDELNAELDALSDE